MAKYVAGIREKKKQQTRDTLAIAAVSITVAEGLEAATIASIAKLANVSSRTFHNYFPHRDAAIRHFFVQYTERVIQKITEMPKGLHPVDLLRSLTLRQFEEMRNTGQRYMQLDTLFVAIHNSPHLDAVSESYMDLQKVASAISDYTDGRLSSMDCYLLINACVGITRGIELALFNSENVSNEKELKLLNGAFDALKRGFSNPS